MIVLRQVAKSFEDGERQKQLFEGLSLKIARGSFVCIRGRSGSGKSTLLKILAGLIVIDQGDVFIEGKAFSTYTANERSDFRRDKIGFIFQEAPLISSKTVFDNIALPLKYQQIAPQEIAQRVEQWLTKLAISPLQKRYPKKLSGGERQRVAIARALITKPQLILADEPTGALDDENERQVMSLLQAHRQPEQTLVLVTHNDALAQAADQVIDIS